MVVGPAVVVGPVVVDGAESTEGTIRSKYESWDNLQSRYQQHTLRVIKNILTKIECKETLSSIVI